MGKILSVCKGNSEEPRKQNCFVSVQDGIVENGSERKIPRVWYEPSERWGTFVSQREVGENCDWSSSESNAEEEVRLAAWHDEQLRAIEEIRASAARMEALRMSEEQLQDEERVAAERKSTEEAKAKAEEEEKQKNDSERAVKAKVIADREGKEMDLKRLARQNGLATTSLSSNTLALEEASEIARRWLTSLDTTEIVVKSVAESQEDEALIDTKESTRKSGLRVRFASASPYASSAATKISPVSPASTCIQSGMIIAAVHVM